MQNLPVWGLPMTEACPGRTGDCPRAITLRRSGKPIARGENRSAANGLEPWDRAHKNECPEAIYINWLWRTKSRGKRDKRCYGFRFHLRSCIMTRQAKKPIASRWSLARCGEILQFCHRWPFFHNTSYTLFYSYQHDFQYRGNSGKSITNGNKELKLTYWFKMTDREHLYSRCVFRYFFCNKKGNYLK